jgi:competence protein ComEC
MKWWVSFSILVLLLLVAGVWREWPVATPVVTQCDVGQGDGLVMTQGFSQLVVDVGAPGAGMLTCLAEVMPFWDRELEVVVITHTDRDHVGALDEVLAHYRVGQVVTSEYALSVLQERVPDRKSLLTVFAGQQLKWGRLLGEVIWPEKREVIPELLEKLKESDTNYYSLVIRWQLSDTESLWLAADVDAKVEAQLLQNERIVPSTILKVAHHGSKTSTSEPFLAKLRPNQAWISVGAKNRYGHPAEEVLGRLEAIGSVIKRTDEMGAVSWKAGKEEWGRK